MRCYIYIEVMSTITDHIDYCYPLSRHDTGLVINTNWFCQQQCFDECEKLHKIIMTWMSKKKMW
jgi:hypothetical protein